MRDIKVLGSGCCGGSQSTIDLINQVATAKGVDVVVEKITDMAVIMGYGVMSTPGVVVDGKVVHAGGTPTREKVEHWITG